MTRYAIYGVPGTGPGAPAAAVAVRERVERWYADEPELTTDPRRYGFHATLKAPFRLAEGRAQDELIEAVARFAAAQPPVVLPGVRPARIGRFRALVPSEQAEIAALAARVVVAFEPFRAALSEEERARRRPDRLTARQRELLDLYGYPYVLDEFRVHMTLTNALDDAAASSVDDRIAAHFASAAGLDVPLTALTVAVEPEPGAPFDTLETLPFDTQETTR